MTDRQKLVADVTVLSDAGATILVRYRDTTRYDDQAGWFVPDDFIRRLEHPDAAATRILREQVGLEPVNLAIDHIESFEGDGAWHVIFHYRATAAGRPALVAGANVAAAEWFDLASLPPAEACAHEGWAIGIVTRVAANAEALTSA
jgi:ADP-ribose pyrophosphatase YjhB (NUDIX family)